MKRAILVLPVLLAACAAPSRSPAEAEVANAKEIERFLASAAAGAVGTYQGSGGSPLAFVGYPETAAKGRCALVFVHGLEGHAGWLDSTARALRAEGCGVYCLDRRGSGRNREGRGYTSGDVESPETLIGDIRPFVLALRTHYRNVFLAGSSWGARLALAYAVERQHDLDGLLLVAPDLSPVVAEEPPFDAGLWTATPARRAELTGDPMRLTTVTGRFLAASRGLDDRVARGIDKVDLPVLLLLSEDDEIADNGVTIEILGESPVVLVTRRYEGVKHGIALDAPDRVAMDAKRWVKGLRRR